MLLIASENTRERLEKLACRRPLAVSFYEADKLADSWEEIEERLAAGEDLLWLGLEGLDFLRKLWLDAEEPREMAGLRFSPKARMDGERQEVILPAAPAAPLAFRPPVRYALHGINEEPRVDLQPLLTAADRFGGEAGVCGVRCRHVEKALTSGSYAGGLWLVATAAGEAISDAVLCLLLEELWLAERGAYLAELLPEYPWYETGERVSIRTRVTNRAGHLQAARLYLRLCHEDGGMEEWALPLMLNCRDSQDVAQDFYPLRPGRYRIEAQLTLDDRMVYGMDRERPGLAADFRTAEFLLRDREHTHVHGYPKAKVQGGRLMVGENAGFHLGTTLYPSSTFFEASYRPLRLERIREEAAVMAETGLRICRLWCDPYLDETSLRGMRAVIEVLAEHGIAAIVTLFSSWTREMWVNTARRRSRFFTADMRTDSLIGLYLQDMEGQCRYAEELAEQYADLPSVIWDLSNEFSVVDVPDAALGGWEQPAASGAAPVERSIHIFRQWAGRLTRTIRAQGARQPLHCGVCCWDTGSDNYLCNRDSDLVATHLYCPPEEIRFLSARTDSRAAGKPFLLEEFGGTWPEDLQRTEAYETRLFEYLAAGFQGAVNYEWGMLWTSSVLSGVPPYMKFNSKTPEAELTGFHYEGRRLYARTWTDGPTGICPWIASSEYGVNWACLPGRTATIRMMKQFARLTGWLTPMTPRAALCVAVPFEVADYRPGAGYPRLRQPLDGLLDRLWSRGVAFVLCQEADLDSVPAGTETIVFPNARPVSEKTRQTLSRHALGGIRVLTDQAAAGYVPGGEMRAVCAERGRIRAHVQEDGSARLVSIFSHEGAEVRFGSVHLAFRGHALYYERDGQPLVAALHGALTVGGELLLRSSMTVGVNLSGPMTLLPFGPGTIQLGCASSVTVRDDARLLAVLTPDEGLLELGREDFGYRYCL